MPLRAVEKLLILLRLLVKTGKRDIALVSTKLVTPPLGHGSRSSRTGEEPRGGERQKPRGEDDP
jgi:hypothetical protein